MQFIRSLVLTGFIAAVAASSGGAQDLGSGLVKVKDIVLYEDASFYSAFPSIVRRPSGELLLAFRRAPERRALGEAGTSHTDPNSHLVTVRSTDNGETWSKAPQLLFAHPFGGSQDPCLVQLRDGSIVCASYGWMLVDEALAAQQEASLRHENFVFMGGYLLRSEDGGASWQGPILPPAVPGNEARTLLHEQCPAYNRGAMVQGTGGELFWSVASQSQIDPRRTENHLLASSDGGLTWTYRCPVAVDDTVTFNECSLYETPKGDLVAFLRTADFDDHTVVARSTDGGKSFQPWEDSGWQGHPHYALRLPDERVLLVYGYRHKPFGVRARVLNAECTDFATAPELVLREDGGNGDLGYPWATMTADGRVLVVYYFNKDNGVRHIAGTLLELAK